jgi:hypothetical protein
MCSRNRLFRTGLLLVALFFCIPGVHGWTFQNWTVMPGQQDLPYGTPVTAQFTLHFDSYMTGSTFESKDTLLLSTDLSTPQWSITKTDLMEDQPPVTSSIPVNPKSLVRLDGWSLSYPRKRFDLTVTLSGTVPAPDPSGRISVVRVQEQDENGKPLTAGSVKKELSMTVTETEQTPPVIVTVSDTPVVVKMEPSAHPSPEAPAPKQTYSPGPGPLLICCLLAVLVYIRACTKRRG